MMKSGDTSRRAKVTPLLLPAIATSLTAAGMWLLTRRYSRFEVSGESMVPALNPGDWIAVDMTAYIKHRPRCGDVVLARDPRDPERTLVKRVDHTDLHSNVWLLGENAESSTDSRTFGPVTPDAILGRVRWRYWPVRRRGYFGPV
ncbi:MAG: nickel-type superoxide dismutase maturation protease [Tepidiformaceae bacterium]